MFSADSFLMVTKASHKAPDHSDVSELSSSPPEPGGAVAPGLSSVTVPEPSHPGLCPLLPSPGTLWVFCPSWRKSSPLLWALGRLLIFDACCGLNVCVPTSPNSHVKAVPCKRGSAGRAFGRWSELDGVTNGISALMSVPTELPSSPCSRPHRDTTRSWPSGIFFFGTCSQHPMIYVSSDFFNVCMCQLGPKLHVARGCLTASPAFPGPPTPMPGM